MQTYSAIIPVYNLTPEKQQAFAFVLQRMLEADCFSEIIVCSQGQTALPIASDRIIYREFPDNVDNIIHKSYLINQGVLIARNEYVWINDPDVWLPFTAIAKSLVDEMVICVQPFKYLSLLDEVSSLVFIESKQINIAGYPKISGLCNGSVIFDRGVYLWMRGYNENVYDWSIEENNEFALRAHELLKVDISNSRGIRLFHQPKITIGSVYNHDAEYDAIQLVENAIQAENAYHIVYEITSSIPLDWTTKHITDTAVVVTCYGANEVRKRAHYTAMRELVRMNVDKPNFYLYELVIENEDPVYETIAKELGYTYIRISGLDRHRDIFQKEAIYNIAITDLPEAYLIFCDADFVNTNPRLTRQIRDTLIENPNVCIQPYSKFFDLKAKYHAWSLAASVADLENGVIRNLNKPYKTKWAQPGGIWAMTKALMTPFMFNVFHVTGGGDTGFCHEYLDLNYCTFAFIRKYYREIYRGKLCRCKCVCIPTTMIHMYHGSYSNRAYNWGKEALGYVGALRLFIRLDPQYRLVEWIDPNVPLRWMLTRKSEMQSEAELESIIQWACKKTKQLIDEESKQY